MRRAFTLIEVLICVAIVVVVAAITYPVMGQAKVSALKTKSASEMRQVHLALELYMQQNDGAPSGTLEAMGLPPWPNDDFLGDQVAGLYPPMRTHENWDSYMYFPVPAAYDERHPSWAEYTQMAGGSAVVIADPFFNPPAPPEYDFYFQDPYVRKFVMGITLSGSLVKKTNAGALDLNFWLD